MPNRGTVQYPFGGTGWYIILAEKRYNTVPLWWHRSLYFGEKQIQYCCAPMVARVGIFWPKRDTALYRLWWHGSVYFGEKYIQYCNNLWWHGSVYFGQKEVLHPYRGTARYILAKKRYCTLSWHGSVHFNQNEIQYPYRGTGRYLLAVPLWWHGSVHFGIKEVQYPYRGSGHLAPKMYSTPTMARFGTPWPKRGIVVPLPWHVSVHFVQKGTVVRLSWRGLVYFGEKEVH